MIRGPIVFVTLRLLLAHAELNPQVDMVFATGDVSLLQEGLALGVIQLKEETKSMPKRSMPESHSTSALSDLVVSLQPEREGVVSSEAMPESKLPFNSSLSLPLPTPVAVLRVPKCASTVFLSTVLLFPGVCPDNGENRKWIIDNGENRKFTDGDPEFLPTCDVSDYTAYTNHSGIDDVYESQVKGHGFIVLRQPEQRIVSAYSFNYHSWPAYLYDGRDPDNMSEYAAAVSGCAVKLLTRSGRSSRAAHDFTVCGDPSPATEAETELAMERLREGFVFVGITENYTLSVCLMIAKYNGVCERDIFANTWPLNETEEPYNITEYLPGFLDEKDGRLYAEAVRIFEEDLSFYGVDEQSCQACWDEAFPVGNK